MTVGLFEPLAARAMARARGGLLKNMGPRRVGGRRCRGEGGVHDPIRNIAFGSAHLSRNLDARDGGGPQPQPQPQGAEALPAAGAGNPENIAAVVESKKKKATTFKYEDKQGVKLLNLCSQGLPHSSPPHQMPSKTRHNQSSLDPQGILLV